MGNRRVVRSAVVASYDTDDYVNGLNGTFLQQNASGEVTGISSDGAVLPIASGEPNFTPGRGLVLDGNTLNSETGIIDASAIQHSVSVNGLNLVGNSSLLPPVQIGSFDVSAVVPSQPSAAGTTLEIGMELFNINTSASGFVRVQFTIDGQAAPVTAFRVGESNFTQNFRFTYQSSNAVKTIAVAVSQNVSCDFLLVAHYSDLVEITAPTYNKLSQTYQQRLAAGSNGDIVRWRGDHFATETFPTTAFNDLTDVNLMTPTSGQVVTFNGTDWVNTSIGFSETLAGLSDVSLTVPIATGNYLQYNGVAWTDLPFSESLDALNDVTLTSPSLDQVLSLNSSGEWINRTFTVALPDLTDVNFSRAPSNQDFLQFNGSAWNVTELRLEGLADVVNSQTEAAGDALIYNGTNWDNTPLLVDTATNVTITTPLANQVLTFNESGQWVNQASQGGSLNLEQLLDVVIQNRANGEVLTFNSTENAWVNATVPVGATTLPGLTDVTFSSTLLDGEVLRYDAASSLWGNAILDLDRISDVTVTNPMANQTLVYDTVTSNFVNSTISVEQLGDTTITAPAVGQFLGRDPTNTLWVNAIPTATNHPVTIYETYAHNIRAQIVNRSTEYVYSAGGFVPTGRPRNLRTNAADGGSPVFEVFWQTDIPISSSDLQAGDRIDIDGSTRDVVSVTFDLNNESGSIFIDPNGPGIMYALGVPIFLGEEARLLYGQLTANVLGQVTFSVTGGLTNQDIDDVFSAETISRGFAPVTRGHLSNNPPLGYGALLNVNETAGRVTGEMIYASNFALGAGRARILAAPLAEVLFERFGPVGPIIMNTSNVGVDREDGVATFAGITGTVSQPGVGATVDSITFDFLLADTTSSFASQFGSGFNTQDWVRPETSNADINTLATQVAANTLTGKRNAGEIQVNVEGIINNANSVTALTSVVTTNTTDIATNVTNIATNTSGIATNVMNIATNTAGLLTKQNTLTAGTNITIVNDVISASGGSLSYDDLALRLKVLLTGGFVFLTKGAKVNRQAYFGSIANETATNYFYDSTAKAWFDADVGGNMLIAFQ